LSNYNVSGKQQRKINDNHHIKTVTSYINLYAKYYDDDDDDDDDNDDDNDDDREEDDMLVTTLLLLILILYFCLGINVTAGLFVKKE